MPRRGAALVILCVLVLPVLAACSSGPTPLCDQAAKLADSHHLTTALARYLDAERGGEGGCATDGQHEVQDRQAQVALVLARASSAERRGAVKEAEDLYVQALTQDVDSEQARAGLARLQTSRSASPTASPAPLPSTSGGTGPDPVIVIVVTVVVLVAIATAVIAALAHQRGRPGPVRPGTPAGMPWLTGGGDPARRAERVEARVAFLQQAVERLAAAAPVPTVRTDVVEPRATSGGAPKGALVVTHVTALRVPDADRLVLACRRLVHDEARPDDELVRELAGLGTSQVLHLENVLEEAAIAAATRGRLDASWDVRQEGWLVADPARLDAGAEAVRALPEQLFGLLIGRPIGRVPEDAALSGPIVSTAEQVAGEVADPGARFGGAAVVIMQAVGIGVRPAAGPPSLLTAAVRSMVYDVTADLVAATLRGTLPEAQARGRDAGDVQEPASRPARPDPHLVPGMPPSGTSAGPG